MPWDEDCIDKNKLYPRNLLFKMQKMRIISFTYILRQSRSSCGQQNVTLWKA